MYTISKYKNFVLMPHNPKFINITQFIQLINQPLENKYATHILEMQSLINCGIYLNNNINLLKNHQFYNDIYEKNLMNVSNTILLRSMNIYKPYKTFNHIISLNNAIKVYDMMYAVQIRTIINPLNNTQIQKDIDGLVYNSVINIHEQLLEVDYIMENKK